MRTVSYYRRGGTVATKLNTVSVIELSNTEFQGIRSFADNPEGNKRAEQVFRRLIEEYENASLPEDAPRSDEEDFQAYIEDGMYERTGYQLILSHSV
jgi:hypothetical protein